MQAKQVGPGNYGWIWIYWYLQTQAYDWEPWFQTLKEDDIEEKEVLAQGFAEWMLYRFRNMIFKNLG